jgi:hypothetical protein
MSDLRKKHRGIARHDRGFRRSAACNRACGKNGQIEREIQLNSPTSPNLPHHRLMPEQDSHSRALIVPRGADPAPSGANWTGRWPGGCPDPCSSAQARAADQPRSKRARHRERPFPPRRQRLQLVALLRAVGRTPLDLKGVNSGQPVPPGIRHGGQGRA